jgi:outer membrane usher protein
VNPRWSALVLAAVASGAAAGGEPAVAPSLAAQAEGAAPADRAPAYLAPLVNGVRGDPILVVVTAADVLARLEDLTALGLGPIRAGVEAAPGGALVSLRALAPDLRYEVDDAQLELRLAAGPALLARRALDLRPVVRPKGIAGEEAPAGFFNYAARASTSGPATGTAELGASAGGWLALGAVSLPEDGEVVRGLSSVSREWRDRLLRFTIGDVLVAPEPLGSGPIVGGVSLERDADLDPYLLRAPLPRAIAFAGTPSTLEVWVNGALVRSMPVAPGTYDLSNLPVTTGQNDVQVVVRDAFGRAETLSSSRYQAQGLLAPGLHLWGWTVGATRTGFGLRSFGYETPVLLGRHRLGLTDSLTGGARVEATPELVSGGLSLVVALPFGALQAAGAASAHGGDPGASALVAWRTSAGRASAGLDLTWSSPRYATADDLGARPRWRAGADATLLLSRAASARLGASWSELATGETLGVVDAAAALRLTPRAFLQLGATASRAGDRRPELTGLVTLVLAAGPSTTADVSSQAQRAGVAGSAGVQRPLPLGEGVGYRVRAATLPGAGPDATDVGALLQAQTGFGRYEVEYQRSLGRDDGAVTASGALVVVDGKLFATRPVTGSFALVEVPQVAGVRVRVNEQPAGRTDADGDLLVPSLLPYYASRVRIEDADVPLDRAVGATERLVAPPRRGAARLGFETPSLAAIRGRLHLAWRGGEAVPAYGTLAVEVDDVLHTSPIAEDGEFWLEGIPAGMHAARILWRGLACTFSLSVPKDAPAVLAKGDLGCTAAVAPPAASPPMTAPPP